MTTQADRWAIVKQLALLAVLLIIIAGAGYLLYTIIVFDWPIKSGLDEFIPPQPKPEGYERAKTMWDWLQLLIVPLVLAIAAFFLNRTERINTEKAAERRAESEHKIADQRAQQERLIADQRAQQERLIAQQQAMNTVLEKFFDRMTELLIQNGLRTSQPKAEVRDIARVRTLASIRQLDAERNQILLHFLYDGELLKGGDYEGEGIIDLSNSILKGVDLRGADLRRANLQGVHLQEANLNNAYLYKANLHRAFLDAANLAGVSMLETNLQRAGLPKANLQGAFLHGADLRGAFLEGANLMWANLDHADLRGANLRNTIGLDTADFLDRSIYDETTLWPYDFVPPVLTIAPPDESTIDIPLKQP